MLSNSRPYATLPASDLNRARDFYGNKLGLPVDRDDEVGVYYKMADGTSFFVFESMGQSNGTHTQLGLEVGDIESEVADLKNRGVVFEEYDYPNFKSVNGIVDVPAGRAAWFKDSEGNLIGVFQRA